MDRVNSQGVPVEQLAWVLTQRKLVLQARKRDRCLLCCCAQVNEAGLCEVCTALLPDHELRLAERWMAGTGP